LQRKGGIFLQQRIIRGKRIFHENTVTKRIGGLPFLGKPVVIPGPVLFAEEGFPLIELDNWN